MRPMGDGGHAGRAAGRHDAPSAGRSHLTYEQLRLAIPRSGGVLLKILRGRSNLALSLVLGASFLSSLVCAIPVSAGASNAIPQAATATISGRVSVASSQGVSNNLSSITVKLTGPAPATTSQEEVSENDGRFQFAHLLPGNYKLEVSVEGFK